MCSGVRVSEAHKPRQAGGGARVGGEGGVKGGGGKGGTRVMEELKELEGAELSSEVGFEREAVKVFWGGAEMPPG